MTRTSTLPVALAAVASAAALAAWGTFGEETHATREYLVVLALIGVAALVVFGWAVPRALQSPAVGWTAITLGVLGLRQRRRVLERLAAGPRQRRRRARLGAARHPPGQDRNRSRHHRVNEQ